MKVDSRGQIIYPISGKKVGSKPDKFPGGPTKAEKEKAQKEKENPGVVRAKIKKSSSIVSVNEKSQNSLIKGPRKKRETELRVGYTHPTEDLLGVDPGLLDDDEVWEEPDPFKDHKSKSISARTKESVAAGLGNRVRKAMELVDGLDQEELASLTGYSRGNLNRVIKGRQFPSIPLLIRLSEILGVTVDHLLGIRTDKNVLHEHIQTLRKRDEFMFILTATISRMLSEATVYREKDLPGVKEAAREIVKQVKTQMDTKPDTELQDDKV